MPFINTVVRDWIILVIIILTLIGSGALIGILVSPTAGTVLVSAGWGVLAIFGIYDGVKRILGQPSFLGSGRGLSRLLGGVQILLCLALLVTTLGSILSL